MRRDLSSAQWDAVDRGQLMAPDERVFTRRSTRLKRKEALALVDAGCAVVVYWPGGLPEKTQLLWHDGEDARVAFGQVKALLSSDRPDPRKGTSATAGRWESPEGDALVVVTWHH